MITGGPDTGTADLPSGPETAGKMVRRFRIRARLSQLDLSLASGSTPSVISRIESGKTPNPQESTLRRLAVALGLSRSETVALIAAASPRGHVIDLDSMPEDGSGIAAADGSLGRALHTHRLAAGLDQEQLARRSGISRRTVAEIERGRRFTIQTQSAVRLATVLNLDEDQREAFFALAAGRDPTVLAIAGGPPLYGRAGDYARVQRALHNSRLVTVIGPGGVGKTSLAMVVARQHSAAATLSLVTAPAGTELGAAIAAISGLDRPDAQAPVPVRALWPEASLLVLDNLEHLTGVAAAMPELLASDAGIAVLATSRTALGVPGETVIELGPLDEDSATAMLRDLVASAAARPGSEQLAAICQRLDRLPLAIEMVPGWLAESSPGELLAGLAIGVESLPLQPLTASVRRSLDILSPTARIVFAVMALSAAPWPRRLLVAVARATGQPDDELLPAIRALTRSGLVRDDRVEEASALVMLQTVRDVAAAELAAMPELGAAARRRHAEELLRIGQTENLRLSGPGAAEARRRLDAVQLHVQDAMTFWLQHPDGSDGSDGSDGLRLARAWWRYWRLRGLYRFGLEMLTRARAGALRPQATDDAETLHGAAVLGYLAGHADQAVSDAEHALAIFRELHDATGIGSVISLLGMICFYDRRPDPARRWYEQGLAEVSWADAPLARVVLMLNYAPVLWAFDEQDAAIATAEDAADRSELIENYLTLANANGILAEWAISRGDLKGGRHRLEVAARSFEAVGERAGQVGAGLELAQLALATGDADAAHLHIAEALAQPIAADDPYQQALCAALQAEVVLLRGDPAAAQQAAEAAIGPADQLPYDVAAVRARAVLAFAAVLGDELAAAQEAARAALSLCPASMIPMVLNLSAVIAELADTTHADVDADQVDRLRALIRHLSAGRGDVPSAAAGLALARLRAIRSGPVAPARRISGTPDSLDTGVAAIRVLAMAISGQNAAS